jgi:hypothetical protein
MEKPMRAPRTPFLLGFLLALIVLPPFEAQTPGNPPADTNANAKAANPTSAGQAPDELTKKISELVHAGKYTEAQQLNTGLLLAYPEDQRLIKAKALLETLLAATPGSNQPTNNGASAQPVTNTNAVKFTGMDKVEYNSLIELARQAQQITDLEQQKASLKQFMDRSSAFLHKYPDQMLLWQLRAASALSLDDLMAGYEAGQKLLAAGAADSNDPNLQQLLSRLNLKGWLDKQKVEDERKQQADIAEAVRLKAEHDKYTFLVQHYRVFGSGYGHLTINENDLVYDGSDGNIRFSKSELRKVEFNALVSGSFKFILNNGKAFDFIPVTENMVANKSTGASMPLAAALWKAVVERWRLISTENKETLTPANL